MDHGFIEQGWTTHHMRVNHAAHDVEQLKPLPPKRIRLSDQAKTNILHGVVIVLVLLFLGLNIHVHNSLKPQARTGVCAQ